jgi:two-component system, cell cycle sensor histidine kinase and response regulator CckA
MASAASPPPVAPGGDLVLGVGDCARNVGADVTGVTPAEDEARGLAAQLTETLESITDAFFTVDREWRFTFLNREAERLLKRTRAELLGRILWEEFPAAIGTLFEREYRRALAENQTVAFEEFYRPLNAWRSVRAYPSVQGLAVYFHDITERKQESADLLASRERLALATESARIGIWDWDVVANNLVWDARMYELYGVRVPDFSGAFDAWQNGLHPEDRARAEQEVRAALDGVKALDTEFRVMWPSGEVRDIEAHAVVQRAGDGSATHMIGVNWDITERKRAAEALRAREAELGALAEASQRQQSELRVLFDLMPALIWFKDTQNTIVRVNRRAAESAGKSIAELEGQSMFEVYPQDAGKYYSDDLEMIRSGTSKLGIVETLRDRDGKELWVQTDKVLVHDEGGKVIGIVVMAQDITERKRAAETLRTSLEEFQTLAEAMPQMVWITRPDGGNVYFNQQWMDYTGITLEESLGHGWSKPFHPDDRDRAELAWRQATADLGTYSLECRLRRADGAYRWWLVRAAAQKDAAGKILKWFGTCTDIHDLKVAELAVAESERRFAKIFETGLVAIGITEAASGRVVDVNERFAAFFGYAREEMVGRTVAELRLWADPADGARYLAEFAAGVAGPGREAGYRLKSGEIRQALITTEGLTLAGIAEPLKVSIVVDVTERNDLQAQLLQSQRMDAIGRLAGGVAHDFNNTLGVIVGYAELLMRQASDGQRPKLEQILKAGHRAAGLTRQLLTFSRKEVVEPKVLDLNALLSDLEQMLGRLIGEDIDLAIVAGPDLGQVKADAGQLEQVVMNLCVNARDAMPDGGFLRVETANVLLDRGHAARHEAMPPGRYVMLTVGDTGGGIPKDVLPNIFEPFFTTKEAGKGTGLGLAMVYGIVKQAGGNVWVYSEIGRGTTFKIYLPRVDEPLAAEPQEAPAPSRGSETILLVEDEASLRALTREILEGHGYRVIEATSGSEALTVAQGHPEPIHLLLTDVVMPGINGRALAEALAPARPGLRVLYMSGYTDDIIAKRGVLEAGTLLLEKPFAALALLRGVREALGTTDSGETT